MLLFRQSCIHFGLQVTRLLKDYRRNKWEVGVLRGGEGKIWEIMQQCSIFRNRKKSWYEKAKKKRGGSRECKVQEMAGLDPLIPQIDYE